jgi:AraC-like DNA-binding protein
LARVFLSPIDSQFFYIEYLTWFSALLWLTIYSIVLIKPEILYGYRYLQKIADYTSEKSFFSTYIWHLEQPNKAIVSQKDLMLSEKISSLIASYIHNLENISLNTDFIRNPECNINELAIELKLPISHLSYLFKYHCNNSFVDYKKIVRIHDAANLIKQGYVKTNTIESLATLVGFITYSTFSIAFKEITGNTAQEFVDEKNKELAG